MRNNILDALRDYILRPQQFWPYPRILLDTLVSGISLTIAVALLMRSYGVDFHAFFAENGPHEQLQTAALAAASILSILAAVRLRSAGRYVAITTAFICLMFFTREIPSCHGSVTTGCIPKGMHKIVAITSGVILIQQALSLLLLSPKAFFRIIHPAFSWPLALTALLLVTGQVFESNHMEAMEETLELLAYTVLLLSSVWMLKSALHRHDLHFTNKVLAALSRRLQPPTKRHR